MEEIKYIYFEIKHLKGIDSTEPKIENENALLIRPNTNSSGIWMFTNITERKGFSEPSFSIVNQYWIDLDKFSEERSQSIFQTKLKEQIAEVLKRINEKL